MKKTNPLVRMLVLMMAASVMVSLFVQAQGTEGARKVVMEQLVEKESRIQDWQSQANLLTFLTVLVGMLGLVTSALQAGKKRWCKITTIVIGIVISSITLINSTVFSTDYRTLKLNVARSRHIVREIRYISADMESKAEADQKALLDEIVKRLQGIDAIEEEMLKKDVAMRLATDLLSPVFAQSSQPGWISRLPEDRINLYSLGKSSNQSLARAREDSYYQGIDQIVSQLQSRTVSQRTAQVRLSGDDSLHDYAKKSAEIANTYYAYDSSSKVWVYYTLLKINRLRMDGNVIGLYGLDKGFAPTTLEQRHRIVLGGEFQQQISIYVGDIHKTKPFPVIVFQTGPESASWQDTSRITPEELRARLPMERRLVDRNVTGGKPEPIRFTWNQKSYLLNWSVKVSTFNTDYFSFVIVRP